MADKIMQRISENASARWVCTPRDFLDIGSREAVDQALSRLVKASRLRRVSRGLYHEPRISALLKQPTPVNLDAAIAAIARRDGIQIMPDGMAAANQLGLTNAVPARPCYVTDGASRSIEIDGRNDPLPACESKRHALGGKSGSPGRSGAPVAWSCSLSGPPGRLDPETPSPGCVVKRGLVRRTDKTCPAGRYRWRTQHYDR